jgi:hypothetical protein
VLRSARAVRRADPLRYDALAAELAGLLVDDLAVADVMMPGDGLRSKSWVSPALRISIGSLRKSSPSSSSKSKAQSTAAWS